MSTEFPIRTVLELSCAAHRTYGLYLKESQSILDAEGKFRFIKHSNKDLIKYSLGIISKSIDFQPIQLTILDEDTEQADIIVKYFRRLLFSAVKGDNEFYTEVNALLNSNTIEKQKIGFIACLPSVYLREIQNTDFNKKLNECENTSIGEIGSSIFDKDCEVLRVKRSENFPAWNVLAIVDNRIASWFSSKEISVGPGVIQKAKIKNIGENWQTKRIETRLNYVKLAQ